MAVAKGRAGTKGRTGVRDKAKAKGMAGQIQNKVQKSKGGPQVRNMRHGHRK